MSATIFCKTLTLLAAAALGFAGYSSVRLAWADSLFRANTPESVKKATAIDPGNASYHAWLAEIEEHDGLDPEPELEIASKLNPSASAIWEMRNSAHSAGSAPPARSNSPSGRPSKNSVTRSGHRGSKPKSRNWMPERAISVVGLE